MRKQKQIRLLCFVIRMPKAKNLAHKMNNTESGCFLFIYWKLHIEKRQRICETRYKNLKFDKQILLSNQEILCLIFF